MVYLIWPRASDSVPAISLLMSKSLCPTTVRSANSVPLIEIMSPLQSDVSQLLHLNPILESQKLLAICLVPSWHDFGGKVALVHPVSHLSWKLFSTIPAHCCSVLCSAWGFSENLTIARIYSGIKAQPVLLWSVHLGVSTVSPPIEVYGGEERAFITAHKHLGSCCLPLESLFQFYCL